MFHPGLWPQATEADSRAKSKDSEIVPSLSSIMRACSDITAMVTGPFVAGSCTIPVSAGSIAVIKAGPRKKETP